MNGVGLFPVSRVEVLFSSDFRGGSGLAFAPTSSPMFQALPTMYRVFLKNVLHKLEEKMQEKMKMTKQKDQNMVQVQQQCSVYLCKKNIFKS